MIEPTPLPSYELLHSRLYYNSETGDLIWKDRDVSSCKREQDARCWNKKYSGTIAGVDNHGYLRLQIDGIKYFNHRIVWKMVTGKDPEFEIDHINLDRKDNRFANLRDTDSSQNARNKQTSCRNTSGFKGVDFKKNCGKWRASIRVNGVQTCLGIFDTAEEASQAYINAVEPYHGEFGRIK
jgi:hypothetical protein